MERTLKGTVAGPLRRGLRRAGFELLRTSEIPQPPDDFATPADCDPHTRAIVERVKPYTLTPPPRVMALCEAVRYIDRAGIEGPIVECGVWKGGSMMAAALALLESGTPRRDIYLYDAFNTKMPAAEERDTHISGKPGPDFFAEVVAADEFYDLVPSSQVRELIESTGFPHERLHVVEGFVEDTIPAQAPDQIALLRLDTDWYRSTIHEMRHLYGRIVSGGVLIVDDYGEFAGAKQAVDEHLAADGRPVLVNRVDLSCRLIQVP